MGTKPVAENNLKDLGIGTIEKCVNCHQESDSFVLAECSHVFCTACYLPLFAKLELGIQAHCPEDGKIIAFDYEVIRSMQVDGEKQLVPKSRMPCTNREAGCDKMMFFHDMKDHLNICVYRLLPSCPQGCNQKVIYKDLVTHLTSSCNCRLVKCQYCKDDVALNMIEKHEFQCPQKLVTCSYCNKGWILQKELHFHIQNCEMSPGSCIMRELGCAFEGTKKDAEVHQENWSCHIGVLVKHVSSLQEQINDLSGRMDKLPQVTQNHFPASNQKQREDNSTVCVDGVYLWQIKSITEMITTIEDFTIGTYSPKFYMFEQGYHMCLQLLWIKKEVCLRISVEEGVNDSSLSWPFAQKIKVVILDQFEGMHHSIEIDTKDKTENFYLEEFKTSKWVGWIANLIEPERLLCKESPFIRNNIMIIKFMVLK